MKKISDILSEMKELKCELCGGQAHHTHHVFGASNKNNSEKYGLLARLCIYCHTGSNRAVHQCRDTDLKLKRKYQEKFEETYTMDDFIRVFGRNYIQEVEE